MSHASTTRIRPADRPAPLARLPDPQLESEDSVGFLVRQAHRIFVKALARELAKYRISTGQWTVLRVLWKEDGMTQVELAEQMGVEKASLTGLLAGLARRRLITRRPNRGDRRKINIHLTAAGRALEKKLLPCGQRVNDRAIADLPPAEVARFNATIRRMVHNLTTAPLS